MKKLFLCIISVSIVLLSAVNSYAAESVSFVCGDTSCAVNRLVTVDINAECSKKLCAATFKFSFDSSMFEYRSVKSDDSDTIVKAYETDGIVKVEFLNTDGKDISGGKTIFKFTLKAIKEGNGYLDFTVSDCVDEDVKFLDIGKCVSAGISVSNKSDSSDSDPQNSGKGNSNSENKDKQNGNGKSVHNKEADKATSSSYDMLGFLNPNNSDKMKFLFSGIAIGAILIIGLFAAYSLGKRRVNNNTEKDNIKNQENINSE